MGTVLATEMPVFAIGIVFGAVLLCLGLAVGFWLGRRTALPYRAESLDNFHLINLLDGLSQWTNGFASDVSQYREVLQRLCQRFQSFEHDGASDSEATVVGLLSQIVDVNEQLQQRLDNAEGALQNQAEEITAYMSEARTDTLTGLANRRVFDDELSRRIAEWRRSGVPVSVLLADIDHFKRFNDEYGHLAGDAVLADVSRVLRETMRETDLVARIGGEEFAVILPDSPAADVQQGAERARRAIASAAFCYEGKQLRVTVSCGAARAATGEETTSLVKRADDALYASKAAGRNAAHWHDGQACRLLTRRPAATRAAAGAPPSPAEQQAAAPDFDEVRDELRKRLLAVVADED